ncbi:hypothetical protein [Desulfitispora alkaliphila]|uniref:hypothetical protein n=1 Tax=Desulfitispora alkaliphila TaxID=622674 RepID=UPI003D1AB273
MILLLVALLWSLNTGLDNKNNISKLEDRIQELEKRLTYEFKEITLEELPAYEPLIVVVKDVDGEKVAYQGSITATNNKINVEGRVEGVVEVYKKHKNENRLIREVHF